MLCFPYTHCTKFTLKSTSVSVCFRGIGRLTSAFVFLRLFKLARISIQVCTKFSLTKPNHCKWNQRLNDKIWNGIGKPHSWKAKRGYFQNLWNISLWKIWSKCDFCFSCQFHKLFCNIQRWLRQICHCKWINHSIIFISRLHCFSIVVLKRFGKLLQMPNYAAFIINFSVGNMAFIWVCLKHLFLEWKCFALRIQVLIENDMLHLQRIKPLETHVERNGQSCVK